ncbi:MAG TPA: nuclear transport factor 2 family protein [Brevundimonas sp.]|nr:nuclear transport factor 2 family protein [Brevundimonas sp.]
MSRLATALRLSRAALAGAWLLAMIGSGLAQAQAAGHAEENSSSATASSRDLTSLFRALEAERQDAFARGDRAVLERHFAEEYVHTNLRGGTTNREEELAFFGPGSFTLESGTISDIIVCRCDLL